MAPSVLGILAPSVLGGIAPPVRAAQRAFGATSPNAPSAQILMAPPARVRVAACNVGVRNTLAGADEPVTSRFRLK